MKKSLLLFITAVLFASCNNDPNKPYNDTPTSGKVSIAADETLRLLADAQKDTFMGLYRYATINMKVLPESECFKALLNDSVKVILSTRKLRSDEEAVFKSHNLYPVTTRIAYDAIALVINKENNDSLLSVSHLKDMLEGKITNWNQLNSSSKLGDMSIVFDNEGSSTVRFLNDSILRGSKIGPNCFAVHSNQEVIDYVEKHKSSIGVIGVSWISSGAEPTTQLTLGKVRVMELTEKDNAIFPDDYFKPYQAYIALKQYPLIREVYMINREGRAGLGTGFVSFVAGDKGQRVVRISGLLPASMPVRLIQTN